MALLDIFKDSIGIDPGSNYLRILNDKGELVFNEKARISLTTTNVAIAGLGNSIPENNADVVIKPVDYVINDFQAFEMLLRGAISNGLKPKSILPKSYRMYFAIPVNSTECDKRVYRDSAEHAAAVELYMIHQSYCAAIAMNLLHDVKRFILIDFGASKIEISIFSDETIIAAGVIKFGTSKINELTRNFLRRNHKIEISDQEITNIWRTLNDHEMHDEIKIQYTTVKTKEIQAVLDNIFYLVNDEIMQTIELVSNHQDIEKIIINGVYFTGGGSTLKFLTQQIKLDSRIKRTVSQNPLLDTITGLKMVMQNKEKYKSYLMT